VGDFCWEMVRRSGRSLGINHRLQRGGELKDGKERPEMIEFILHWREPMA